MLSLTELPPVTRRVPGLPVWAASRHRCRQPTSDWCHGQVSAYLGDLRMRSVNMAMSRVGSRENLSTTAAAFMDLAEEEEGDHVSWDSE